VVLWLGIGLGLVTGLGLSRWQGYSYSPPIFNYIWLALLGFLSQFFAIYLVNIRIIVPDWLAALSILISQLVLLIFAWLNRHNFGMMILIMGLVLNLIVMTANKGFMPINPSTAEQVIGTERISSYKLGDRIGYKDILLPVTETRLEMLADRFLPPKSFPHQVAFSLGDVFIAFGAFWILAYQKNT